MLAYEVVTGSIHYTQCTIAPHCYIVNTSDVLATYASTDRLLRIIRSFYEYKLTSFAAYIANCLISCASWFIPLCEDFAWPGTRSYDVVSYSLGTRRLPSTLCAVHAPAHGLPSQQSAGSPPTPYVSLSPAAAALSTTPRGPWSSACIRPSSCVPSRTALRRLYAVPLSWRPSLPRRRGWIGASLWALSAPQSSIHGGRTWRCMGDAATSELKMKSCHYGSPRSRKERRNGFCSSLGAGRRDYPHGNLYPHLQKSPETNVVEFGMEWKEER